MILAAAVRSLEKRSAEWIAAIMAVVLLAGAVYSLQLGAAFRYGDESDYYAIGENLLARHVFAESGDTPGTWRPPGYPFLVMAFRLVGLGPVALRLLNFALLALGILVMYRLVLRDRGMPLAGVLAGALVLAYPVLFYTAGTLFPQTVGTFLLLVCLERLTADAGWRGPAVAGLVFGALLLLIPSFLTLLPILALHPWVLGQGRRLRRAAVFVVLALAVVAPWTARNYRVSGRLVLVSSNGGINLLQGNSENTATILGGGVSARDVDLSRYTDEAQRRFAGDDAAAAAYYTQMAVRWIDEHRAEAAKLYLRKCLYYFAYRNDLAVSSENSRVRDLVMLVTYGLLLLLFAIRVALCRRVPFSRLEWLVLACCLVNLLTSALFYPRIRFRLPFDQLLMMVDAVGLATLLRPRGREEAAASASAAGGAAA